MLLTVGRIGRAHGVRGDVLVAVRTDEPDARFAPGRVLATDPVGVGPLTVERSRWHSGRLVVGFAGVHDRDAAEALNGVRLVIDSAELEPSADPDEFHDHELIGMAAVGVDGAKLGMVTDVLHGPAGELLVVDTTNAGGAPDTAGGGLGTGGELLVPFVRDIVVAVERAGGRVVVDPPPGLLGL